MSAFVVPAVTHPVTPHPVTLHVRQGSRGGAVPARTGTGPFRALLVPEIPRRQHRCHRIV